MSDHKDCKRYDDCDFRNDVGWCPESCRQYKHKDDVRVVRCKYCEYWTKQVDSLQGRCALGGHYPTGNWYCANGERKTDE